MINSKYYRIESFDNLPIIGKVYDTDLMSDTKRIKRYNELSPLFDLFYQGSILYDLPIAYFFDLVYTRNYFKRQRLKRNFGVDREYINSILKEKKKCRFRLYSEGRFFFDYVLKIAGEQISLQENKTLPDRFKSKYFFETLEDCSSYIAEKGQGKIIEVEIIEEVHLLKIDNRLLNYFENNSKSIDLLSQAIRTLMGEVTAIPLNEIVFQGKYCNII